MKSFAGWVRGLSSLQKTALQAAFSAALFYGGALLENAAQDSIKTDLPRAVVVGFFILVLLGIAIGVFQWVRKAVESMEHEERAKAKQLATAANHMNQFVAAQIRTLTTGTWSEISKEVIASRVFATQDRLTEIVSSVFLLFDEHFGHPEPIGERIDFEVTFMTKSYADKEITIPAYANRTGRAPLSMNNRAKDPKVYQHTETAKLYSSPLPEMKIVEDTIKPDVAYAELYPGQKKRIRSSIVYPVLAENNRVLGALVVHCNRSSFFKEADRAHWTELLETFARRLALEKARLDFAVETAGTVMPDLAIPTPF